MLKIWGIKKIYHAKKVLNLSFLDTGISFYLC